MRCLAIVLLLETAIVVSGCDTRSPIPQITSPTYILPPMAPGAPSQPVANWNLNTVLTVVTGPDNCFTQQQQQAGIPRSLSWLMEVTRNGDLVTFDYDTRNYPTDDVRETGTLVANEFTARSETLPIGFATCADGTVLKGTFDARVNGRFSDDGRHIVASEIWAYHFSSGEVTFAIDWSADPR